MNLRGVTIGNRYEIIELVGEGGASTVYKARDLSLSSYTAVKVMKDKVTTRYIEDIIRFRKEVDIVSRLNHQNIIRIFDAGEFEGTPYLVTELLCGKSLDDLIKEQKRFNVNETLQIIKQLAEALIYVHGKSIIHRDLKPGNIFLEDKEGKLNVKLLDFGVSYILEFGELSSQDEVVGTFGYMSPEASGILHRNVDERSDLYSLGVVFYALLAGETPFKGVDINKILHQQAAHSPPEIIKLRDDIPYSVNEVVMKLLFKDPDQRYQSASGLLHDINHILNGNYSFVPGVNDHKVNLTYNTRIIGREMEIQKAEELFERARGGAGSVLLVSGEAGVGKTALVDEVSSIVFEKNDIFLKARCLDQKSKAPYQLFKELINEYIRHIEKMDKDKFENEVQKLKDLTGSFSEIFISLNPAMGKYLGTPQKIMPLEPERENQRLLMVLADFFLNLPESSSIVYFLDDLHWADEGSLNLLKEITGRIGSQRLIIIGTYRNNEIDDRHGLWELKEEAYAKGYPVDEIVLSVLDFMKLNSLIASLLGEREENTGKLTDIVLKKSRGNPLFAINLLRELVEKGAVIRKKDSWEIDWGKLGKMPISRSMVEIVLKRIDKLSEDQKDILRKAAVIGREFDMNLLRKLTVLDMDQFIEMIDSLIAFQLIEWVKETRKLLFVHDRIRDAFYQMLEKSHRRSVHLKIARAIEEEAGEDRERVLFELVHHYIEADDEDKMLQYLIPAAKKAGASYANEEAVKYYVMAINLLNLRKEGDNREWLTCCSNLVDVYLTMGKNDEAISILKEILPLIPEPIKKARAYRKMGIANFKKGDWRGCEDNLSNSLTLLGERLPQNNLEWTLRLVGELIFITLFSRFLWKEKGRDNYCHKEEDREIIRSYLTLNWMYILSDLKKLACNILRMFNLSTTRLPGTEELGLSSSGYAAFLDSAAFFKTAQKYHLQAIKLREEINHEWGVAQSLQFLGFAYS